jgi:hypothetical protein
MSAGDKTAAADFQKQSALYEKEDRQDQASRQ